MLKKYSHGEEEASKKREELGFLQKTAVVAERKLLCCYRSVGFCPDPSSTLPLVAWWLVTSD